MSGIRRKLALPTIFLLGIWFLSSPAVARATGSNADQEDSGRRGLYLGVGAGFASPVFDLPDLPSSADLSADISGLVDARVGYQFHPVFATEMQFQYYPGFDIVVDDDSGETDIDTLDGVSFGGNAKVILPLGRDGDGGGLYALGGVGLLNLEDDAGADDTEFMWRVGGGFDIHLTDNLTFNAEATYLGPTGDFHDFAMVPVVFGFRYQFR
jgi:opacity protein-like surface antigen